MRKTNRSSLKFPPLNQLIYLHFCFCYLTLGVVHEVDRREVELLRFTFLLFFLKRKRKTPNINYTDGVKEEPFDKQFAARHWGLLH